MTHKFLEIILIEPLPLTIPEAVSADAVLRYAPQYSVCDPEFGMVMYASVQSAS